MGLPGKVSFHIILIWYSITIMMVKDTISVSMILNKMVGYRETLARKSELKATKILEA